MSTRNWIILAVVLFVIGIIAVAVDTQAKARQSTLPGIPGPGDTPPPPAPPPVVPPYIPGPGPWAPTTGGYIDDNRKKLINNLAKALYDSIRGSWGDSLVYITAANSLTDTELKFLADQYAGLSTESLAVDVDNEWLPTSKEDEKLITKLTGLGKF